MKQRLQVTIVVLAIVLFGGAALAHAGMTVVETRLFHIIYDMSDGLRTLAILITQTGTAWFLLLLVALLLIIRRKPDLPLRVFMSGVAAFAFAELLKAVVDRPRPFDLLGSVVARDSFAQSAGYPSGHVALATTVGIILWPYLPKAWRWIVPTWIVLVAWSRLYLGVHAPLDIIGGFCLGALIALVPMYLSLQKHKRGRKLK